MAPSGRKQNYAGEPTDDTPPGWYACPWDESRKLYRYFDGVRWTPQTRKWKGTQ